LSTAVAVHWQSNDLPLIEHLRIVESLALIFFLFMLLAASWPVKRREILEGKGNRR
jgi:hypothetical protein